MNKDEIIEEMAKILCDKDKRCEECISRLLLPCGYKSYCTKLYNANYRKVADDEIVIKKSEYEDLRLAKYKAMEEATEYEKTAYKQLEQAKQETREILQTINKYLVGTRGIYTVKTFRNGLFEDIMLVRADDLETLVNKLAKEHDVELEE